MMYVRVASSVASSVLPLSRLLSVNLILARQATTSTKHPFPFPPCVHPTPHEIFHLPRNASQDEIKNRYYELVKVYHPDVTHGQHNDSPSVRNARFRAITHAYGVLRGRHGPSSTPGAWDSSGSRDEAMRAELRRRSRRSRSASSTTTMDTDSVQHKSTDDTKLRYNLFAFVLGGIFVAMISVSSHVDYVERHSKSAAAHLAQVRAEAQVYGMERRRKIREHVRAFHEEGETVDKSERPEMCGTSKAWPSELLALGETVPRKRVE